MASFQASIVIPVHNKWELTRNCLKSLAGTTDRENVEVIVVDNASGDATPQACVFLGEKLFGNSFRFIRNEQNRNFSGACNQGAETALGKFLIFLNNDIVAQPGWYAPLLQDFAEFPDIAATGSLLLYPGESLLGHAVQHLGVFVTPYLKFGHLYLGLPETSALAKKRRFFQAITGACLAISKNLFLEAGGFDEGYINGFEDIDLCARLVGKGYRFTVNPDSRIFHHEGQTAGRGKDDMHNLDRLIMGNARHFVPDWQIHLEADGFFLDLNESAHFQPRLQISVEEELDYDLPRAPLEDLKRLVLDSIYWEAGWQELLRRVVVDQEELLAWFKVYLKFFPAVPNAAKAIILGRQFRDEELQKKGELLLRSLDRKPGELLADAQAGFKHCSSHGFQTLAERYKTWIDNYDYFLRNLYPSWQTEYFSLLKGDA